MGGDKVLNEIAGMYPTQGPAYGWVGHLDRTKRGEQGREDNQAACPA